MPREAPCTSETWWTPDDDDDDDETAEAAPVTSERRARLSGPPQPEWATRRERCRATEEAPRAETAIPVRIFSAVRCIASAHGEPRDDTPQEPMDKNVARLEKGG
jgi:hypothetical protein